MSIRSGFIRVVTAPVAPWRSWSRSPRTGFARFSPSVRSRDASGYGSKYLPFDISNRKEVDLRAPIKWLRAIRIPTFVFEGTEKRSNIDSVMALSRASRNPLVHFHPAKCADQFSILAPVSRPVASKILRDDGVSSNIKFTENELTGALHK